jgi:hypothetical protein
MQLHNTPLYCFFLQVPSVYALIAFSYGTDCNIVYQINRNHSIIRAELTEIFFLLLVLGCINHMTSCTCHL